ALLLVLRRVAALLGVATLIGVGTLFWVGALFGVATLVRVAAARRVRLVPLRRVAALFWVAALVGRVGAARVRRRRPGGRGRGTGRVFWPASVAFVVVIVGGPTLSLTAAVARVVGHRCYSLFCVERVS